MVILFLIRYQANTLDYDQQDNCRLRHADSRESSVVKTGWTCRAWCDNRYFAHRNGGAPNAGAACYYGGKTLGYDTLTAVPPDVPAGITGAPKSANWGCFSVLTCTPEGVLVNSVRHLAGGTDQPGSDSSPQTPAAWGAGDDGYLAKLDYRLHKCMAANWRRRCDDPALMFSTTSGLMTNLVSAAPFTRNDPAADPYGAMYARWAHVLDANASASTAKYLRPAGSAIAAGDRPWGADADTTAWAPRPVVWWPRNHTYVVADSSNGDTAQPTQVLAVDDGARRSWRAAASGGAALDAASRDYLRYERPAGWASYVEPEHGDRFGLAESDLDVFCQVGYQASGGALRNYAEADAAKLFPELDGLGQSVDYVRYRCMWVNQTVTHQQNQLECKVEKLDFLHRLHSSKNCAFCFDFLHS